MYNYFIMTYFVEFQTKPSLPPYQGSIQCQQIMDAMQ